MGNLGPYQWIVTASKKVGGPIKLLVLTAVGGAAIGIGAYKGGEQIVKKVTNKTKNKNVLLTKQSSSIGKSYLVIRSAKNNEGVRFAPGEQIRILEQDGESILIEKINGHDNPYVVSKEFLKKISNYNE